MKYEGVLSCIYRLFGHNKIHVEKGNAFNIGHTFMKRCHISIGGHGNVVDLEPGLTRLTNTSIFVSGTNNHILIMGGGKFGKCIFAY